MACVHDKSSIKSVPNSESSANQAADLYRDLKPVIEEMPIGEVKLYERNARKHSKRQIELIANSFASFGCVSPLTVDADGVLISGHGRLAAAKLLNRKTVLVIRVEHLDDHQKRALRIADNQLATLAEWDANMLAIEFNDLLTIELSGEIQFDLSVTGFSPAEIDRFVEPAVKSPDLDESVPEPDFRKPPLSRLGDVFLLGEHRIACGDARDALVYTELMGDERAAMGIHDAPYNVSITKHVTKSGRHAEFAMGVGELSVAEFTVFLTSFLKAATAVSAPGAIQFAFMDWRHLPEMLGAGQEAGLELKQFCVWDKGVGAMGSFYRSQHELVFVFKEPSAPYLNNVQLGRFGRNRTNVWAWPGAASLRKELELHPTPKPVSMIAEAIRDVTKRNDIVLDCFSGSGTTILAAAKAGRRARVIELDPHYVDVAIRRWEAWSGETARHAATGLSLTELAEQRSASGNSNEPLAEHPASPIIRVRQRAPLAQIAE